MTIYYVSLFYESVKDERNIYIVLTWLKPGICNNQHISLKSRRVTRIIRAGRTPKSLKFGTTALLVVIDWKRLEFQVAKVP